MTFEEFWDNAGWHTDFKEDVREVWDAAQQAEREKYAELITAAEAVIKQWEPPLCPVIYRLLDVIERMKNEN